MSFSRFSFLFVGLVGTLENLYAESTFCDFSNLKAPRISSTGSVIMDAPVGVNLDDLENFGDLRVGQKFDFPVSDNTSIKLELKARGTFPDGMDYSLVQDKTTGEYVYLVRRPGPQGTTEFEMYQRGSGGKLGEKISVTRVGTGSAPDIQILERNRELLVKPSLQLSSVERKARQNVRELRAAEYSKIRERGTLGTTRSPAPDDKVADNLPSNFKELSAVADKIFSPEGEKKILDNIKKMRFVKSSQADGASGDARQIFEFKLNDNTFVSYAVSSSDGVVTTREVLIGVKEADGKFRFAGFAETPGQVVTDANGKQFYNAAFSNKADRAIARPLRHGGDSKCMNCHAFNGNGFFNTSSGGQRVQRFFNGEPDGVAPGGSLPPLGDGKPRVLRERPRGVEIEVVEPDQLLSTF